MASYNKFNQFVEDVGNGVHNLSSDTIKLALTNSAPVATNTILANITQISTAGGYPSGGMTLDNVTYSQTSGTATFDADDETLIASGADIDAFRYAVLYNDTPTSPADPLIGWWDLGSSLGITDGNSRTFQLTTVLFTLV